MPFKRSVQFDLDDPEAVRKLLDIAVRVSMETGGRASLGAGGKYLLELLLKRPDLLDQLTGGDSDADEPPKEGSQRRRR